MHRFVQDVWEDGLASHHDGICMTAFVCSRLTMQIANVQQPASTMQTGSPKNASSKSNHYNHFAQANPYLEAA